MTVIPLDPHLKTEAYLHRRFATLDRLERLSIYLHAEPSITYPHKERLRTKLLKVVNEAFSHFQGSQRQFKRSFRYTRGLLFPGYRAMFSRATTIDDVKRCAGQILRDIDILKEAEPPLGRFYRGIASGAFFIDYTKHKEGVPRNIRYVAKWTHPMEQVSQVIYSVVLGLIRPPARIFLHIPETTMIARDLPSISQCFKRGVGQGDPGEDLMLSPRAPGITLCDYLAGQYSRLTPAQKQLFFSSLALIAMLDILLGYEDRFLRFKTDTILEEEIARGVSPQIFTSDHANLGNLLVDQRGDDFHYSLIDNGFIPKINAKAMGIFMEIFPRGQVDVLAHLMLREISGAFTEDKFPDASLASVRPAIASLNRDTADVGIVDATQRGWREARSVLKAMIEFYRSPSFPVFLATLQESFRDTRGIEQLPLLAGRLALLAE